MNKYEIVLTINGTARLFVEGDNQKDAERKAEGLLIDAVGTPLIEDLNIEPYLTKEIF